MNAEDFKQYLDFVVSQAFQKGAMWFASGTEPLVDAIKRAQEEILECKKG